LLLGLGLIAAAPAAESPGKPPTREQVAAWVKGLASDSFDEREAASKALWKAGRAAETALRQVLKDGDAEAIRRAREILDKFDWGLYPDTPEAVRQLIEEYRAGTPENRAAVVAKLLDLGSPGYTALMKIAGMEKDEQARAQIAQLLAADMPRLAAALLAAGQDTRLEEALEQGFAGDSEAPLAHYAAYLLVRGKLDDKLRELQKKAGAAPDKKTALTLAYLCRARGDVAGARRYAEKAEHPNLLQTILIEQEDWKGLLKQLDTPQARVAERLDNSAGFRLACLRLAGERDAFDAEMRKLAAEIPLSVGCSVFLLNGRVEDAQAALMNNTASGTVAELLAARGRFREALDVAEKHAENDGDPTTVRYFRAGLLARLGERKKAREALDKLAADVKPGDTPGPALALLSAEHSAGFKEDAFARAAALLAQFGDVGDTGSILLALFPASEVETGVEPWWRFLRRKYPQDAPAATLKRLRDLLGRKTPARETAALLKEMADEATNLKEDEREPWLHCVADTCRALSRDDLLEGYLEKWAAAGGDARPWLALGDLSAEKKRWKDAAERYHRAWEKDRSDALPLYLHGRALVQAGQEKEGRRLIAMAEALPLGSEEKRTALAAGLAERGLDEAADKEWERLGRLSLVTSAYDMTTSLMLAEKAIGARDYLKAATYYRRTGFSYAILSAGDVDFSLWALAAERRCRARALAAAGRFDEMHQEINSALAVEPNIDLAIDLTAELAKAGRKEEADALFARVYAAHDAVCKQYPQSAWQHNNTAWLAVRCKRDLDAALEHARKGVELDPDNSGHLDTLAEVYFQRGDKGKAVELMKKCLEMQPRSAYFRNQLKRMRAGNPEADLPREPSPGSPNR
jgi:predicted Zn-dependent protease